MRLSRQKVFGLPVRPLDRNLKAKLMVLARAKLRKVVPRKHYGELSAKHLQVFRSLLYDFHNAATGKCFPSYDLICEKVGCCRQTVANALAALEKVGLIEVVNRLVRTRVIDAELQLVRTRVLRTSNGYTFRLTGDLAPRPRLEGSKSNIQTGTPDQVLSVSLRSALDRLGSAIRRDKTAAAQPGLFDKGVSSA